MCALRVEHPGQMYVTGSGDKIIHKDAASIVPSHLGDWVEVPTKSTTTGVFGTSQKYVDFEIPVGIQDILYMGLEYTISNAGVTACYLKPTFYHVDRIEVHAANGIIETTYPEALHMRACLRFGDTVLQKIAHTMAMNEPLGNRSAVATAGRTYGPYGNRDPLSGADPFSVIAASTGSISKLWLPIVNGLTEADLPVAALVNDRVVIRVYFQTATNIQQYTSGTYATDLSISNLYLYIHNQPLTMKVASEINALVSQHTTIYPMVEFRISRYSGQTHAAGTYAQRYLTAAEHNRVAGLFFATQPNTVTFDNWTYTQPSNMSILDVDGTYITGRDTHISLLNLRARIEFRDSRFIEFVQWAPFIFSTDITKTIVWGLDRGTTRIRYNQQLRFNPSGSGTYDEIMLIILNRQLVVKGGRLWVSD